MELFYYCYKAPKGEREMESDKYQKLYQPADYIPEYIHEEEKGEYEEEQPLTYTELNESVKDMEGAELEPYIPQLLLPEPELELEPVQEEEVDLTILQNTDYLTEKKISASKKRSFKRPSFKWKKKEKKHALFADPPLPDPAPEGANEDELGEISVDPVILLNTDQAPVVDLGCKKISLDSLTEKVKEKEEEAASTASANDEEVVKLQASLDSYQSLVNEQKAMLDRLQRENADMMSRITLTEHANGVALHDSYLETEKTKSAYQNQIAELSLYPERLKTAEARYNESEEGRVALQDKLNESNQTISSLNGKIDILSESISGIREKYHVVSEDNIELSAKSQQHERKVLEADEHNKNLINMVTKKDDTIEAQQPAEPSAPAETELDGGKVKSPPSPSSTTDNNASEEEAVPDIMQESGSDSETSESSESEDEVDWSAMLKDAEANRERLGMDVIESSGESEEDENGVRVKVKGKSNGLNTQDMLNRMATNELLGYDEFGRPITSKHQVSSATGLSSHNRRHKKRSLLFGTDTKGRSKTKGANNRSVNKEGKSGGRRSKNKGGGAMLLGF